MTRNPSIIITAIAAITAAPASAVPDGGLFVAPDGNDSWSGRLAGPNEDKTDGPFATIERARDEIRRWKMEDTHGVPRQIEVVIEGGDYTLSTPLAFNHLDSGWDWGKIIYRAADGEAVRLLGGTRIGRFEPVTGEEVLRRIPENARTHVVQADLKAAGVSDFGEVATLGKRMELFFDGRPMTPARWPNEGFAHVGELEGGKPIKVHGLDGDSVGRFTYEGDRTSRWAGEDEIWLHGYWFWDWSDGYQRVRSIDSNARIIELAEPYHNYGYRKGQRYYAFNLLSELDSPGEWHADHESGMLYFWPPGRPDNDEVFISVLDTLLTLDDVHHVSFEGLTFSYNRGTAIQIRDGSNCEVRNSTLTNLGWHGVVVNGGHSHRVSDCDIYNIGGSGISMTGGDRATLTLCNHQAVNNHIHHYSRARKTYQTGVNVHGVGCRVAHNLIHDVPHMALGLSGNDHLFEYNEVHHVCMETDDAGAIYMGRDWTWRDNVIRFNYFHDIGDFKSHVGTQAIYLDDWASDTLVYGNIVQRAYRAILVGGGRDTTIANNILIDCQIGVHIDSRGLGWAKNYFSGETNTLTERLNAMPFKQPPWSERFPELLTLYDDEPALAKYNKVVCNITSNCKKWLDLHNGLTQDVVEVRDNFNDVEPLFVDPDGRSFRLRDDSPASKNGCFQPIPMDMIGLQRDRK